MTLYEIDQQIMALFEVDPDTGEVNFDEAAYNDLQLARETKIENLACYVKNLNAEETALKAEEKALADRRKSLEKKEARLRSVLHDALAGQKFASPRAEVTWRKSTAVEVFDDAFYNCEYNADLCTYTPKCDKTAVKAALKAGRNVPGASLVENLNMSIK
jgi:outer membrane murein-binding lipoprotein Lpp